jgi:hypothetical protein
LKGNSKDWPRDKVFYEYYWEAAFPQTPTMFSVRTPRYKYIYYNGIWDINELFDLQNDPFEMNNLIRDSSYRKIGLQLKDDLFNWLGNTNGLQIPLKKTINNRGDNLYKGTY